MLGKLKKGISFLSGYLILFAVQVQGCEVLLSEDLQDGQVVGGVRVVNPFLCEIGRI
jgi:predicted nucleic acid-binding protein